MPEIERVLGLDVGERRIGVAVSDPLGLTAQGVRTIQSRGVERDLAAIAEIAGQYGAKRLVVGLPKNMDGSVGFQAERVMEFAARLERLGYRIQYQDERLTSASATRTLLEADVSRKKRKQVIDKLAATYILQGFLDGGGLSRR